MDADNLLNNNGFDYGGAATGNPVSPDTPPAPNGNYFDGDYGSEAAFDDLLNSVPPAKHLHSKWGLIPMMGLCHLQQLWRWIVGHHLLLHN